MTMLHRSLTLITIALPIFSQAQKLTKPPLVNALSYLNPALITSLSVAHSTYEPWVGWIPSDCQTIADNANLHPADVTTFNVTYSDCGEPWFLCRHNDSPESIDTLIAQFGSIPVHMRQWVRHVIALPDTATHAYNWNGNIAMFNTFNQDPTILIHETGHSLDLHGAYLGGQALSSSQNWLDNYNADPNVPDPYSQTNLVEDVAQNTVVAVYNQNVPGGFPGIEPGHANIFHQYATVETWANAAAPGQILRQGGSCTKRLEHSVPVQLPKTKPPVTGPIIEHGGGSPRLDMIDPSTNVAVNGSVRAVPRSVGVSRKPDVRLGAALKVIPPATFDTRQDCHFH